MAFTLESLAEFKLRLLDKLLSEADVVIRPRIPSVTLREAMRKRVDLAGRNPKGDLFIPHYWSVMIHDGYRAFGPKEANFLVYFVHEEDDPRKPRPERAADARRLTKEEFDAGILENRRLANVNPGGGPMQHMIVVKTPSGGPGRVGPRQGAFFFTDGAQPFEERVDELVLAEVDAFVQRNLVKETLAARIVI